MVTTAIDPDAPLGSEIVVAVGDDEEEATRPGATGPGLAERLGLPLRALHVDPVDGTDLARSIAGSLGDGSILVIHSEHANRWSGKWSVAEHVIDEWGGLTVATGGHHVAVWRRGPVLVGVDGSDDAERSIAGARSLARSFGVGVVVCRVVPAADGDQANAIATELKQRLAEGGIDSVDIATPVGNDPISTLVGEAEKRSSAAIVLSSRGDRTSKRASISRTCSGVIAGAVQPVVIVGSRLAGSA